MNTFYEEIKDIYRLKIPFENIYTSVFLIKSPSGVILVDCATTSEDVDRYIVPALGEMGYRCSDIRMLVLTHKHKDHAGGVSRLLSLEPSIEVITDVRTLCDGLCTYPMAGHTKDCIGILDMRSNTLISGDGLQGAGVDKYRCSLDNKSAYIETLERIKNDKTIENVLFSHAYEPWNKENAMGRRDVEKCLFECVKYINGATE